MYHILFDRETSRLYNVATFIGGFDMAKIQKWGNSMALRIPTSTMRTWGIEEGQTVNLKVEDGALIARPTQPRYTLAELLAQCDFSQPLSAEDREWVDAPPVGREKI